MAAKTTTMEVGGIEYEVTITGDGKAEAAEVGEAVVVLEGWGNTVDVHIKPDKMEEVTIVPQKDNMDFCAFFNAEHVADTSPTTAANNSDADYSEDLFWYFSDMRFEQL
jgi:hypothetical protein